MYDETELNPELEGFAASLRNVSAPDANIDRDQLMYDAGWAAAMTSSRNENAPVATLNRKSGFSSMILSFAGGVAVATAVLLSVVPASNDYATDQPSVAVTESVTVPEQQIAASNPINSEDSSSTPVDLMEWIDNLPPGHSFALGFSSRPVSPNLTEAKASLTLPTNERQREPTNQALMQELIPRQRKLTIIPSWTAWLTPGA